MYLTMHRTFLLAIKKQAPDLEEDKSHHAHKVCTGQSEWYCQCVSTRVSVDLLSVTVSIDTWTVE